MQNGPGRSKTILVRSERALIQKYVESLRALIDQNYIFVNCERALRGPKQVCFCEVWSGPGSDKEIFVRPDRALGATETGVFKRASVGHGEVLRSEGL